MIDTENKNLDFEDDELEDTDQSLQESIEDNLAEEGIKPVVRLDYTLQTPQERNELVKQIIDSTPPEKLTNRYLEILTDYIIFAMDKEERKEKKILTDNRMVTVNKRETSYQGLISKFENGEDGIYNMIANDKNIIFTPKVSITPQDLEEIPALRDLKEAIAQVEAQVGRASGKKKYLLKKQLIEMRQDQYVIKNAYHPPMYCVNAVKSFSTMDFSESVVITEEGEVKSNAVITLFDSKHVSALLCNYSRLKEDAYGKFYSDSYFLMEDLDSLVERTLKEKYPLYYDLLIYKIDGKQNIEIQKLLLDDHGIKHSVEYISSLWRNKIPKLLAEQAQEEYLLWYFTMKEKGKWKKCSRCGEVKLAHNRFFSKNKTSRDGFYSICKACRNKKK
ncbi:MAG: hypothetical protein J6V44_17980 [Methanobrevibacter sp.]|nr:hypothetical protein [Methanobrevibacter sp.]